MDSTLTHVVAVSAVQRANSPIYNLLLKNITVTSAYPGVVHARLTIDKHHTNSKGGLHGTLTACIVDWAAGMAIASYGRNTTGVSTDIHISYLASAMEGETLDITAKALKMGGTLAFLSVEIGKTNHDGETAVVATGLHTKYVKARAA
ncbi:HotDog domain-containing protein [Aspergillus pseudoustus]|uniref:HotDog domain-containing protein n=1 Tax=Aspergillus pseudoustus TaxID=1810923 RepID=A0ABR4J622_9EURO